MTQPNQTRTEVLLSELVDSTQNMLAIAVEAGRLIAEEARSPSLDEERGGSLTRAACSLPTGVFVETNVPHGVKNAECTTVVTFAEDCEPPEYEITEHGHSRLEVRGRGEALALLRALTAALTRHVPDDCQRQALEVEAV